jgi:hypothetical protein
MSGASSRHEQMFRLVFLQRSTRSSEGAIVWQFRISTGTGRHLNRYVLELFRRVTAASSGALLRLRPDMRTDTSGTREASLLSVFVGILFLCVLALFAATEVRDETSTTASVAASR